MKKPTLIFIVTILVGWQTFAKEQASLAGVVVSVNDNELSHVIVRVTQTDCASDCPTPRYTTTDERGQFYFFKLPNASYELDVIDDGGKTLPSP